MKTRKSAWGIAQSQPGKIDLVLHLEKTKQNKTKGKERDLILALFFGTWKRREHN